MIILVIDIIIVVIIIIPVIVIVIIVNIIMIRPNEPLFILLTLFSLCFARATVTMFLSDKILHGQIVSKQ